MARSACICIAGPGGPLRMNRDVRAEIAFLIGTLAAGLIRRLGHPACARRSSVGPAKAAVRDPSRGRGMSEEEARAVDNPYLRRVPAAVRWRLPVYPGGPAGTAATRLPAGGRLNGRLFESSPIAPLKGRCQCRAADDQATSQLRLLFRFPRIIRLLRHLSRNQSDCPRRKFFSKFGFMPVISAHRLNLPCAARAPIRPFATVWPVSVVSYDTWLRKNVEMFKFVRGSVAARVPPAIGPAWIDAEIPLIVR